VALLKLDHNVASELAVRLERSGHDVVTTRVTGEPRATDDALLLSSVRTNRLFITHNRDDFRLLHDAWTTWPAAFGVALPAHPGILVLHSATPEVLAQVINAFLDSTPLQRLANSIFWWHRHDGWREPAIYGTWAPMRLDADP
jgi:hypothetical protein